MTKDNLSIKKEVVLMRQPLFQFITINLCLSVILKSEFIPEKLGINSIPAYCC